MEVVERSDKLIADLVERTSQGLHGEGLAEFARLVAAECVKICDKWEQQGDPEQNCADVIATEIRDAFGIRG